MLQNIIRADIKLKKKHHKPIIKHNNVIVEKKSSSNSSEIDNQFMFNKSTSTESIIMCDKSTSTEDFQKRKRVKNTVPQFERCMAKRANGEQCTRRKKDGSCFCGTHIKGTPHGVVDDSKEPTQQVKKVEVWVQEIKGINYYIDAEKNVYLPEDIISNSKRPRVIGTWEKQGDEYSIPNLEEYS